MKNIYLKLNIPAIFLLLIFTMACEDLDTQNLNNPDTQQVLASGNDLPGFIAGGYITWWQGNHQSRPGMTLGVAADAISCSWGNFGMQRMSEEPRAAYNNSSAETDDYKDVIKYPWARNLSAQFIANNVIGGLNSGLTLGDATADKMLLTSAYLLRGLARGYLGLIFDEAYLTDENTDLTQSIEFSPYTVMIEGAVSDMEQVIQIASGEVFTMDASFINGLALTSDQIVELANSYAARFLAQAARNATDNSSTNWQRVLSFAENGLTYDFAPIADGTLWYGYWRYAHISNGGPTGSWARLDQRLVSAFDPSQPSRFPLDGGGLANPEATSDDDRLTSDFTFVASNNFNPSRGLWHYSHYKHSRNISEPEYMGDGVSSGPMPAFTSTDNELLLAEAYYMTGQEAQAAAIINAGSRVVRGNLPEVADSGAEILEAIYYERFIEILNTAPAGQYFDRRRIGPRVNFDNLDALGGLQTGTPAHMPVPAEELEIFELEPYNFGGANDPDGLSRQ